MDTTNDIINFITFIQFHLTSTVHFQSLSSFSSSFSRRHTDYKYYCLFNIQQKHTHEQTSLFESCDSRRSSSMLSFLVRKQSLSSLIRCFVRSSVILWTLHSNVLCVCFPVPVRSFFDLVLFLYIHIFDRFPSPLLPLKRILLLKLNGQQQQP